MPLQGPKWGAGRPDASGMLESLRESDSPTHSNRHWKTVAVVLQPLPDFNLTIGRCDARRQTR